MFQAQHGLCFQLAWGFHLFLRPGIEANFPGETPMISQKFRAKVGVTPSVYGSERMFY